jgi:hypothetical protein
MGKWLQSGVMVYVMWGLGLAGLVFQTIVALFLNTQVKASGNMNTTRKKLFRTIRQKNESSKTLGLRVQDYDAFLDKYFYRMKVVGIPVSEVGRAMKLFRLAVLLVAAGGLLFSLKLENPEMLQKELVLNGVIAAAFLAAVENIIPIKNKIGLMKANVRDYLLNSGRLQEGRERMTAPASGGKQGEPKEAEAAATVQPANPEEPAALPERRQGAAAKAVSKMSDDEILALFLRNYLRE